MRVLMRKKIEGFADEHNACCRVARLCESNCEIVLPNPPRIVIGGDRYRDNHNWQKKICDGVAFWYDSESSSVAVIELKGGAVPRSSVEQLQEGANIAGLLAQVKIKKFAAILVTKKGLHPEDRKVIFKAKVNFEGRRYPIEILRCGKRITDATPWK